MLPYHLPGPNCHIHSTVHSSSRASMAAHFGRAPTLSSVPGAQDVSHPVRSKRTHYSGMSSSQGPSGSSQDPTPAISGSRRSPIYWGERTRPVVDFNRTAATRSHRTSSNTTGTAMQDQLHKQHSTTADGPIAPSASPLPGNMKLGTRRLWPGLTPLKATQRRQGAHPKRASNSSSLQSAGKVLPPELPAEGVTVPKRAVSVMAPVNIVYMQGTGSGSPQPPKQQEQQQGQRQHPGRGQQGNQPGLPREGQQGSGSSAAPQPPNKPPPAVPQGPDWDGLLLNLPEALVCKCA